MKTKEQPWLIIGIIDAYGAIHHEPIYRAQPNKSQCHSTYWPNASHKRWRFILSEWELTKSVLSAYGSLKVKNGKLWVVPVKTRRIAIDFMRV